MIDESRFSKAEFPGEYTVRVSVTGEYCFEVKAENLEEAISKAHEEMEKQIEYGIELGDDADYDRPWVRPKESMFRVMMDGKKCQVSRLSDKCTPRDPDERGF